MKSTLGNLARLEARPGKEAELAEFLKSALPLAQGESGTNVWFAAQTGPSSFAIFDTYPDEDGRQAHLNGDIAEALFAKADEYLSQPPSIEMLDILAAKEPR